MRKFILSILTMTVLGGSVIGITRPIDGEIIVTTDPVIVEREKPTTAYIIHGKDFDNIAVYPYDVTFTQEDINLISLMIDNVTTYTTSDEEKKKLAWLVMNRVDSEEFPDTIQEVLLQEGQFSIPNHNIINAKTYSLVHSVLYDHTEEYHGDDVERLLEKDYLYFSGNGLENVFRKDW